MRRRSRSSEGRGLLVAARSTATEPMTEPIDLCIRPVYLMKVAAPSILTLSALAFCMTAAQLAQSRDFRPCASLILLAALFDALDGHVARLFRTVSIFGAELDSLCDLSNFGLCPALVVFAWAKNPQVQLKTGGFETWILWFGCVTFACCCALRLARFNCGESGPAAQQARAVRGRSPRASARGGRIPSNPPSDNDTASTRAKLCFFNKSKFFQGVPAPMRASEKSKTTSTVL